MYTLKYFYIIFFTFVLVTSNISNSVSTASYLSMLHNTTQYRSMSHLPSPIHNPPPVHHDFVARSTSDLARQPDILWLDCHTFCMKGAQVRVLEHPDQERLRCVLQDLQCISLNSDVCVVTQWVLQTGSKRVLLILVCVAL